MTIERLPKIEGKEYEKLMACRFSEQGHHVEPEPRIKGLTPDLLVASSNGVCCIVECTILHLEQKWQDELDVHSRFIRDLSDPWTNNRRFWEKLEGKAGRYTLDIVRDLPFVIALYDMDIDWDCMAVETCFGRHDLVLEISNSYAKGAFGRSTVTSNRWHRPLSREDCPAFFEQGNRQHVSAIIQSTHLWKAIRRDDGQLSRVPYDDMARHLLIPNPWAHTPVSEDLFQFCEVLDLRNEDDIWSIAHNEDGSVKTRKPKIART